MKWLAATPWSIALHESLYVWPFLESAHVLTLTLFVGTAVALDLRLLGILLPQVPASEFTTRVLPWTRAAFAIMAITGVLLFYATPVTYYQSLFFRLKVLLLVVAAGNIWYFHGRTHPGIARWDVAIRPPRAARVAAIVSLCAWGGIVVAGRLVAYNWFSCDIQPQPALINWVQACEVPLSSP